MMVLKIKYLLMKTLFKHQIPQKTSEVWREIVSTRKALCKRVLFLNMEWFVI